MSQKETTEEDEIPNIYEQFKNVFCVSRDVAVAVLRSFDLIDLNWAETEFVKNREKILQKLDIPVGIGQQNLELEALEEPVQCEICSGTLPGLRAKCGHMACRECWKMYFKFSIQQYKMGQMHCYKCQCPVSDRDLEAFCGKDLYEKYRQFMYENELAKRTDVCRCPGGCGTVLNLRRQRKHERYVECGKCHAVVCCWCKKEDHFPCSCEEVEKWVKVVEGQPLWVRRELGAFEQRKLKLDETRKAMRMEQAKFQADCHLRRVDDAWGAPVQTLGVFHEEYLKLLRENRPVSEFRDMLDKFLVGDEDFLLDGVRDVKQCPACQRLWCKTGCDIITCPCGREWNWNSISLPQDVASNASSKYSRPPGIMDQEKFQYFRQCRATYVQRLRSRKDDEVDLTPNRGVTKEKIIEARRVLDLAWLRLIWLSVYEFLHPDRFQELKDLVDRLLQETYTLSRIFHRQIDMLNIDEKVRCVLKVLEDVERAINS